MSTAVDDLDELDVVVDLQHDVLLLDASTWACSGREDRGGYHPHGPGDERLARGPPLVPGPPFPRLARLRPGRVGVHSLACITSATQNNTTQGPAGPSTALDNGYIYI
eukprot:COSAG05_NODE_1597_length_4454_cov_228.028932_2_plen_108_part_00